MRTSVFFRTVFSSSLAPCLGLASILAVQPAWAQPAVTVEINGAFNYVVDSNVLSPSTYAPSVATISGEVCNLGTVPLTDVVAYIGDFSNQTPGIYPTRDSSDAAFISEHSGLANTGLYSFTHVGGSAGTGDATRYVGDLGIGECRHQYWHMTYPRRGNPDNTGPAVWGASNDPDDDLWLTYDVWVTTAEGASADDTQRSTMRNEISANANKIEPNTGLWFNEPSVVQPGQTITTNGVNYDLGNINKGFDNDGDLQFDYNAWLQPVGDPAFDPSCYRLVETFGQIIINRSGGDPDFVFDFQDQLYFTDLPANNTGGTGTVFYTFLALDGPCSTAITPYQEVASGADNEKFAGDFGTATPAMNSLATELTLDKTVDLDQTVAGGTLSFSMAFANPGSTDVGFPDLGTPLVIRDSIPTGTSYVAGSAASSLSFSPNNGVRILFSDDNGVTWSQAEPPDATTVTDIQWWLQDAFPAGASGTASFNVQVDSPYSGAPFIENTGALSFGNATPFLDDTTVTLVQGTNSIGDLVWQDDDQDGTLNGAEVGLSGVTVQLYYDADGDGAVSDGDTVISTTTTAGDGTYSFTNLPDGDFLVVVARDDAALPTGLAPTTELTVAVTDLGGTTTSPVTDADFGFAPPILIDKNLVGASPFSEGDLISYTIDVTNRVAASGSGGGGDSCEFVTWAESVVSTDFTDAANMTGAAGPDQVYGSSGFAQGGNPGEALLDNWNLLTQTGASIGNIVQVEALVRLYISGTLSNDFLQTEIWRGGAVVQTDIWNATDLNVYGSTSVNAGLLVWDVTGTGWTWTDFPNSTGTGGQIELTPDRTGNNDGALIFVDAVGFRITTDESCGGSNAGNVLSLLPLTDTYDPTLLEFVSATPPPSSVVAGTLTWDDISAELNTAVPSTAQVTVTFRALEPPDNDADGENDSATVTNTACTSGGTYADGAPTNAICDSDVATLDPRGSVTGTVWNDNGSGGGVASNGTQDGTEQGIPNVTVNLFSDPNGNGDHTDDGVLIATTTTDADGNYSFDGLDDGNYVAVVDSSTLPGSTFTQSGDPDGTLDDRTGGSLDNANGVSTDDDISGWDFGYTIPNALYGSIFNDLDGDGVQDPGEGDLSGVTVRLEDCGADGICGNGDDGATTTLVTDANGDFSFEDVLDGNYRVVVDTTTLPAGAVWSQTLDPDATVDDQTTSVISVSGGTVYGAYDFAYQPTGSSTIGDTLFTDWDGDGTQDAGDEGIAGVTIFLYEDEDGDGVVDPEDALIATTTTAADGTYSFAGLPADDYTVVVDETDTDLPSTWVQSFDPDGTADGKTSVTVDGITSVDTVDFGYQPSGGASIGDTVFNDIDRDGIQDATEGGIAGITVTLYEDSNGNGVIDAADAVVATTETNLDGNYQFVDLAAGSYLVDVDTTDTSLPTDGNGDPYVLTTGNDPLAVTVTATQSFVDADFGFGIGAVISDALWRDDNGDGTQSETEGGIANVTVELYLDVDGDGLYTMGTDTLVDTQVTDSSGIYEFNGLEAGNYVVRVDLTDPDLPSTTVTGDPDLVINGETGLTVEPFQIVKFADFGFQPPGVIGDTLWIDDDGDGVYDVSEEEGLAGVTVELRDSGGVLIATTTTDAEGNYSFGDLADGTYTVTVVTATLPANLQATYDPDEGAGCAVCDSVGTATVTAGSVNLGIDFGYQRLPVPDLWMDKDTTTPTVSAGGTATYVIVVQNPGTATSQDVTISDTLPAGFTYASTVSVVENGATRTATTDPTVGDAAPTWGTWDIAAKGTLVLTFIVDVAGGTAAGTYDNTASATYDFDGDGTPDTTIDDDGTAAQDAGTRPTFDPEDDEDVTVGPSPNLGFTKASDAGASASPGDVITYTLTLTNSGTAIANNVTISDGVPVGTAYVASSVSVSTPVDQPAVNYLDDLEPAAYNGSDGSLDWSTSAFTEIGDDSNPANGDVEVLADLGDNSIRIRRSGNGIQRSADLSSYSTATLRFEYRREAFDNASDLVTVEVSPDGATWTTLATYDGSTVATDAAYVAASFDISAQIAAGTSFRFLSSGLGVNDFFFVDNVEIEAVGRATGTFSGNDPSGLVVAADGYDLYPGETMTVTFQVQVDNPAPLAVTSIDNTAFASADELTEPLSAQTSDPLVTPNNASIGDLVWDDQDGDGVLDGGETGLQNIRVVLFSPGGDGILGTADDVQVAAQITDASGAYDFTGLSAGDYRVQVDEASLPPSYESTTGGTFFDVTLATNSDDFNDADFGYDQNIVALPVSLARLDSFHSGGSLRVTWTTATEIGNVGFVLWGRSLDRGRPVTDLIPSQGFDSTAPQTYSVDLPDSGLRTLWLQDIDTRGRARFHGPFTVGETHGAAPVRKSVPWAAAREALESLGAEASSTLNKSVDPRDLSVLIGVAQSGVYRVGDAELQALGLDLTGLRTDSLSLTRRGEPVPLRVLGGSIWGPGSAVELVGHPADTLYQAEGLYRLSWTGGHDALGADATPVPTTGPVIESHLATRFFGEPRAYSFAAGGDDPWYHQDMLSYGSPFNASFSFDLADRVPGTPVDLRVALWGVTDWPGIDDHHLQVKVDGQVLEDRLFDGRESLELDLALPESALDGPSVSFDLHLPGDTGRPWDLIALDDFGARYQRLLKAENGRLEFELDADAGDRVSVHGFAGADVVIYRQRTDDEAPRRITSFETAVAADGSREIVFAAAPGQATYWLMEPAVADSPSLRSIAVPTDPADGLPEQADVLVVSHPLFVDGLAPWIATRQSQGSGVLVATTDEIYNAYSGAEVDPDAIAGFIRRVAATTGIRSVMLVGGDTFDYHDHLGLGAVSFLPSPYAQTGDLVLFAPADPLYGDVDGDRIPDLGIGRLPVRTPAELDDVVSKILDFEIGSHRHQALFATDRSDPQARLSFSVTSDRLAASVASVFSVSHAHIDELGKDNARQALLDGINQGAGLTHYFGHSAPTVWSFDGLLGLGDVDGLTNIGGPTVAVQWGCWNTYFVDPRNESLGAALLLSGRQGAASVLGATTLTEPESDLALASLLLPLTTAPGLTLGEALTQAKQELIYPSARIFADGFESGNLSAWTGGGATPSSAGMDVILGWTLLGDPTLRLNP